MKILVGLLIKKKIEKEEDIRKYTSDIMTYIQHIDKLIIYNMIDDGLQNFYQDISRYKNIEYANCSDLGEVNNYRRVMYQASKEKADFAVILEQDYFYEEDTFLTLKRTLLEWSGELPAVLSAYPMYTCETFQSNIHNQRKVKGLHLVGTFINVADYEESKGFDEGYYETTFDYDYCIERRLAGKDIWVVNNQVIRNRNFKVLIKKILTITASTYEKNPVYLYYETRNRYYLWDKFKQLDSEYVKLDKKMFKIEKKEMSLCDPAALYKKDIMEQARKDYQRGCRGKHDLN